MLKLDRAHAVLDRDDGARFDPSTRGWTGHANGETGEAVTLRGAVGWLQRESGHALRVPIGVIGPRATTPAQMEAAEAVGRGLAQMGLSVICGGRQGVMEAVSRGVSGAGGTVIGLLPETDPALGNPYLSVAIATGIGEARNALIARAAFCLIAVGDSLGTLSEVALGLHFGKTVFGLAGAAAVEGVRHLDTADMVLDTVAKLILSID